MSTLTAVYDLAEGPVSYDYVNWLVRAMLERDRRGCRRLHVVLMPKDDGLGGFARHWGLHDEHATRWRLWHIVVAACPLAQASVALLPARRHVVDGQSGPIWVPNGKAHLLGPLVAAARAGEKIPHLEATPAARAYIKQATSGAGKPIATLTLRNQTTHPDRNTDPAEWEQLSNWLLSKGYAVLELNDTHEVLRGAGGDLQGGAVLDPDLRLALYERAALNVIGNNGPCALMHHSSALYLQFGVGLGEWKEHYEKHLGLKTGDQLPWATPRQRLVYRPATFQVMREEIEKWAGATS